MNKTNLTISSLRHVIVGPIKKEGKKKVRIKKLLGHYKYMGNLEDIKFPSQSKLIIFPLPHRISV